MENIDQGNMFFIPMAPQCGTASRARDRPIPKWLRQGIPSPPPALRKANACCATAAKVFVHGHQNGVFVFIENPTNSYIWLVPCIAALFALEGVFFTTFHLSPSAQRVDSQPLRQSTHQYCVSRPPPNGTLPPGGNHEDAEPSLCCPKMGTLRSFESQTLSRSNSNLRIRAFSG